MSQRLSLHSVRTALCVQKEPGRAGGLTFQREKAITVQIMIKQHMLIKKNKPSEGHFIQYSANFEGVHKKRIKNKVKMCRTLYVVP